VTTEQTEQNGTLYLCSVRSRPMQSTYKKAQLSLTNPRDAKACQNCSNSTCL